MYNIAFIYPGQGAQKVGMGKDFYEKSVIAKDIYDRANKKLDFDLLDVCFRDNEKIDKTEYTQPALVATCLAITRELMDNGIKPDITAGLSLGEYAAIATAGGMDDIDAITTVRRRGIYMSNAVPRKDGGMAAVLGLDNDVVSKVVKNMEDVDIANYNCPGQIVITGKVSGLEKAIEKLNEAGAKRCIKLNVSGPFHSKYLKTAGTKLRSDLNNVNFRELKIPYITNVNAGEVNKVIDTKDLLEKQVSSSVMWEQSMRKMIDLGVNKFVEIGPGKTLRSFLKKIDRNVEVFNVSSMEDISNIREKLC